MKMRPPAIPLIAIDPYFSIWSGADKLTDSDPIHWTEYPMTLKGTVTLDGEEYRFLGSGELPVIDQSDFTLSAFSSDYVFQNSKISLSVSFFAPQFPEDLYLFSRPVSYIRLSYMSLDGKDHNVKVKITASEELCINKKGEEPVEATVTNIGELPSVKMGSVAQRVLERGDDNIRIDWGYLYLTSGRTDGVAESFTSDGMTYVSISLPLIHGKTEYITASYDDIYSINYFGTPRKAFWHTVTDKIEHAIKEAHRDADDLFAECKKRSRELRESACRVGGEKYADLIDLAYRQTVAAHKLITDEDGNIIFISKECLSGGHSATVDVTYPSSPFMLLYNTELLKGALRPIFKFAASERWKYDFAPHDIGTYPIVGQQRYGLRDGGIHLPEMQMPVEECGNMLILAANITIFDGNTDFVKPYLNTLDGWVKYLLKYGEDPENQLCSDDFAGHLAHNCNLSVKAITGIAAYSIILNALGKNHDAEEYMKEAKRMAESWVRRAANTDGSFRLAFDLPGTSGMKYNMVWDKLWGTNLFPPSVMYSEFASSKKHINPYGMTFDSLHTYSKSDWLVWTALLAPTKEEFEEFIAPLWLCYHKSPSRIPMNDFYDTVTSLAMGCRCRSVVGGIFIKLLEEKMRG